LWSADHSLRNAGLECNLSHSFEFKKMLFRIIQIYDRITSVRLSRIASFIFYFISRWFIPLCSIIVYHKLLKELLIWSALTLLRRSAPRSIHMSPSHSGKILQWDQIISFRRLYITLISVSFLSFGTASLVVVCRSM